MTACSLASTSCYFGDIVVVEANDAPVIVSATTFETVLKIDKEIFPVYVACQDDTDDVLNYLWTLDRVVIPDAEDLPNGSQVRLDRNEPDLDGSPLEILVWDSEGAQTDMSWTLEVE